MSQGHLCSGLFIFCSAWLGGNTWDRQERVSLPVRLQLSPSWAEQTWAQMPLTNKQRSYCNRAFIINNIYSIYTLYCHSVVQNSIMNYPQKMTSSIMRSRCLSGNNEHHPYGLLLQTLLVKLAFLREHFLDFLDYKNNAEYPSDDWPKSAYEEMCARMIVCPQSRCISALVPIVTNHYGRLPSLQSSF